MANPNVALEEFVSKKRSEGQSDALILDELVAGGWDRNMALKALAGDMPVAGTPQTSQTGSTQSPIQVENVQYNMKVGTVRSKVGLNVLIFSVLSWALAFIVLLLLLTVSSAILPDGSFSDTSYQDMLLLSVSVMVPVLPLWIYCIKRLNKSLADNPANLDDLFFKRTIRFNFFIWLMISVFWAMATVYNLLDKVVKADKDMTVQTILNSFIFTFVTAGLTYLFWYYQSKTKR